MSFLDDADEEGLEERNSMKKKKPPGLECDALL